MILYHAITAYHILKCAVHKLRYHPQEDAVIMIPSFLVRKFGGLVNGHSSSVFFKCAVFSWEKPYKDKTAEEVFHDIEKEFAQKLDRISFDAFSEINVCSAAYFFGSLLAWKRRPFQWFEEADGRLSQPEPIMLDDARIAPLRYELAVQNGLYTGDNPCVLKKYVKMSAQLPGFSDPMAVDFDVMKEMGLLAPEEKALLLDFFDVPRDLSFEGNSALMLTAHFCNTRQMTYEEHALCYQLTTDYYLEGYRLYYKWHPSDLMPYQSFMENVSMVPAHFPSELLTLVLDKPFEIGASISSTGIYNIGPLYKRVLIFNQEYLKTFWHNHYYYFAVKLMELFPAYKVFAFGINQLQLDNMIGFGGVLEERKVEYLDSLPDAVPDECPALYMIGCQSEFDGTGLQMFFSARKPEDIIVFLNEDGTYPCFSVMDKAQFLVKELQISALDQAEYGTAKGTGRIVVFTKDPTAWRRVEEMKFVKKLLQTGAELDVLATTDKDTQIVALKGMLKATEQQLFKYIEENQVLKEELKRK